MNGDLLIINSGSSSIKFAIYGAALGEDSALRYSGEIEGVGGVGRLRITDRDGRSIARRSIGKKTTHAMALRSLLDWVVECRDSIKMVAAGHRVVHGGNQFVDPVCITPEVISELDALIPLAPQHQPHNIAAIRALEQFHPGLTQVACFDTAFHVTQPHVAAALALPQALSVQGIKRYGFHGLSYEYIASKLADILGDTADGRVIVAHLGHGASLCAMFRRQSIATTMGFSTLDGLMMATRCGSIDPGVILHLLKQKNMTADAIDNLLYNESGLLGVSGESDDIRVLLSSRKAGAAEAIDLFVYRISREIGSLAAALGGLDALIFTGGIGEHSHEIRARVCQKAEWLDVHLEPAENSVGGPWISRPSAPVAVLALPTNEQIVIARACKAILGRMKNVDPSQTCSW